jgi:hypothetical protein
MPNSGAKRLMGCLRSSWRGLNGKYYVFPVAEHAYSHLQQEIHNYTTGQFSVRQEPARQDETDSYACFLTKENIAHCLYRSVYQQKSTVVSWNGFPSSDVLKTRSEWRTLRPYCCVACDCMSTAEDASLQTTVTGISLREHFKLFKYEIIHFFDFPNYLLLKNGCQ